MRLEVVRFGGMLIGGLVALALLLWWLSLTQILERENRQASEAMLQTWQGQVLQLQEKQRLWLQSQFYLLAALTESPDEQLDFQSFVLQYYQRNPDIWAVNLLRFDADGRTIARANRPGCLQPTQMTRRDFDDFFVPRMESCRIDDKALLEIAGPLKVDGERAVLLVSMDYFTFLREFSSLSHRSLERAQDTDAGVQYREFGLAAERGIRVTVPVVEGDSVFGQLHLVVPRLTLGDLIERQTLAMFTILLGAGLAAFALLFVGVLRPLRRLSLAMQDSTGKPADSVDDAILEPGLDLLWRQLDDLQLMAKRDPVTGLNNRLIFEDRLAQAVLEGKRSARKYALILIDLGGLDEIAQNAGQYIADALLRAAAEQLRGRLRESDNLARFERNLFALLLEIRERDQLDALVEKIFLSVSQPLRVHGREFDLAPLLGVAVYPDHALDADSIYQHASNALVVAESAEWPIQYYRENEATDTSGFSLIQALRRAIERDELKLVFQPVVDLDEYLPVYFEALLRWKDPARHELSIEHTVRLAERNHLIKPLTNWIFETACRFISQSPIENLVVGINLSMIDLHDRQLPARIETYLEQYRVKPSQIVIEITEGQIMQDPDEVIEVLAHLGVMGLSLSIDDFGTGQASLTYLKELPVEKLKIDQSFVRDVATNADDQLIVKATIELAHTLDLKVVAEGVETLAVCDLLAEMGCDYVQGYYISRPLEADHVDDWLDASVRPDFAGRRR